MNYVRIGNGCGYSYLMAGTGKARWIRMTLMERIRLRKRRRKQDDFASLRAWIA